MKLVKTFMLPVAMLSGLLFSNFFAGLNFMVPYLITLMLFITFCRIPFSEMAFSPMLWVLLAVQFGGSVALYLLLRPASEALAQGLAMCIMAPTAIAAVVVGGMLGANIATMTSFTLLSNACVAVAAPVFFSVVGTARADFLPSVMQIFARVGPLLLLPFAAAFAVKKVLPVVYETVKKHQIISFYMWALALMTVTGRTVEFIRAQPSSSYTVEIILAGGAFVICIAQFAVGRYIGRRHGDTVAGGQSLGQKNTVLAIWMSQMWLDPISSIAPASYVLWQNSVNSYQLWRKRDEKVQL